MGITFVEKGDKRRKPHAKTGLVLAGGAISGGAFKIGGLIALNAFLEERSVCDFDTYVGISAGAFLAAPLAAGVQPEELLRSIEGRSQRISQFNATHFYKPNWREFIANPIAFARDAVGLLPAVSLTMAGLLTTDRARIINLSRRFLEEPSYRNAEQVVLPMIRAFDRHSHLQRGLSYLPSGLFESSGIEAFIRENFERNGLPNHFRLLQLERNKSLYIGATNLNTAQGVIFGPDADCSVSISEAVQASSSIPGFFRPVRLNGHDYIDGGVRKTANISQAVRAGAQLIIAYNPFRPFVNYHADQLLNGQRTLSDMGILTVINQAFRTLLHTRLMLGIEKLRLDQSFRGDVILIEPSETDITFFNLNPLAFWRRAEAAEHGFSSVKEAIERHHTRIARILARYGIGTNLDRLRHNTELIRQARYDNDAIIDVLEQRVHDRRQIPRRPPQLRVVGQD